MCQYHPYQSSRNMEEGGEEIQELGDGVSWDYPLGTPRHYCSEI